MNFEDNSFEFTIDKGTLDALMVKIIFILIKNYILSVPKIQNYHVDCLQKCFALQN